MQGQDSQFVSSERIETSGVTRAGAHSSLSLKQVEQSAELLTNQASLPAGFQPMELDFFAFAVPHHILVQQAASWIV